MTREAQISTVASIILHVLALLILAAVKLYTDRSMEDNVPVTFLGEQRTIPLRRSIPTRPMVSLDESLQRHSPEQHTARPSYRSSVGSHVSAPERVFSAVKSIGQEVFRDTGIQRPRVDLQEPMSNPMGAELLKEPHLRGVQIQPRISGGHDLLADIVPAQAEPGVGAFDDVLQRFAEAVRGKIESMKKYPIAAQKAGIEGRTGVKMTILKDGRLEKVEIVKPSGYEVLDRAALQSVRDAAPFPPIPQEMGWDEIEMSIDLVFQIT
jgi:TonB family protein